MKLFLYVMQNFELLENQDEDAHLMLVIMSHLVNFNFLKKKK